MDNKYILPSLLAMTIAGTANAGFHSEKTYYTLNTDNQNLIKPFIMDGDDATLEDFPYYARIVTTDFVSQYGDFCGASILSEKYILTAAHCVEDVTDNDVGSIAVIINNSKSGNGEVEIDELLAVKNVSIHESYNSVSFDNDIAVIELSDAITSEFTAIDILSSNQVAQYNAVDEFTAVGLGNTNVVRPSDPICSDDNAVRDQDWFNTCKAESDTPAESLLRAQLQNIGDDECETNVSNYYGSQFSKTKQTCALPIQLEGDVTAVCNGDSGGPLTYFDAGTSTYKQFALVSYGSSLGCDEPDAPQVFTEIAGYKSWLSNFIEIEGVEPDEPITDPSFGDDGNFTSGDSGGSTGLFTLFGLLGLTSLRRKRK